MSVIDLSQLPLPQVVEALDFETLLSARKAALIALYPDAQATLELESEPLTKLLQESVYRELILRQRVNEASQAVMLAFAHSTDLDQLGGNYDLHRLVVAPGDAMALPPVPPTMETDTSFRVRIQQAFEGLSTAGPRQSYEFHARSADGRVADVTAISPAPAEVTVSVLSQEGDGTAPQDLLDLVAKAVNSEAVRPVGDRVTVQSAQIVPYVIEAVLHLSAGPEAPLVQAAAQAQLDAFITARQIGRSIYRSAVLSALHVTGVVYVDLLQPAADLVLDDTQAGFNTLITLSAIADG